MDTDILSELLSGIDQRVVDRSKAYVAEHEVLTFTSVSLYEIVTGLERKQAHARLGRVLTALRLNHEIVPESDDYLLAGQISGKLRRVGREVGHSDPLIAACALRRELSLVTGNQRHFAYIRDQGFPLILENWRVA